MSCVFDKYNVNEAIALEVSRLGYVQLMPEQIKSMREFVDGSNNFASLALFPPDQENLSVCVPMQLIH